MKAMNIAQLCLIAAAGFGLLSCGKTGTMLAVDGGPSPQRVVLGPHVITFDQVDVFSLEISGIYPLAVALDPSNAKVTISPADLKKESPLVFTYTAQNSCSVVGQQEPPTRPLVSLGFMRVKALGVELEGYVKDGNPSVEDPSRMCFGVRMKDGTWRWTLADTLIRYDPSSVRMRARFDVDSSVEIDAVVISVNGSIGRAPAKITYEVVAPP
jgi:hypothetical protein